MDRINRPETIDNPDTPPEIIRATLRDQAVVNRHLGGGFATWSHVIRLIGKTESDPVTILDIGCGGADIARDIIDRARRAHRPVRITALDSNPTVLTIAQELSAAYPELTFTQGDALKLPFGDDEFDIVTMSTILHHLPPESAVTALREADRVSRNWTVVSDLIRSPLACIGFKLFAFITGFHPVSVHDGALSVRKAYTPSELADLAERAGYKKWCIYRHPIYRMTLTHPGESDTP